MDGNKTVIKNLSDFRFATKSFEDISGNYLCSDLEGSVIKVFSENDQNSKRPIRILVKLEEDGENLELISWNNNLLKDLNLYQNTKDIILFSGSIFKNSKTNEFQFILNKISLTNKESKIKIIETYNSNIKEEYKTIINNINNNSFKLLLKSLILDNEDFWKWPAATKMHHNYKGGLAIHSLNVCKSAIELSNKYNKNSQIDIDLVVTAALLHDIGKLREYKEDGSRTTYGNLIPHNVEGYKLILLKSIELKINEPKLTFLEHIILSHHGKLEFGSPVEPYTLEAIIVSEADALDAKLEACSAALLNVNHFSESEKIYVLNGRKIFKL